MEETIRCANKQDITVLKDFLTNAHLGTDGITEETVQYFLLLEEEEGKVTGSLGIEPFENVGLLRSLVVTPGNAERDIWLLFGQALQLAKEKGIKELYLATNKNEVLPLFVTLGFKRTYEDNLPKELCLSEHIQYILNVDNSIFLKFSL
ncbi:MAG: hypothetical protein Q8934_06470 [Bacillota bacterium]|nr:hypothetical protein [Bacillota bacterium]